MGTGSFPEGKERPGRDADPSPPSSAGGHETVELYLYSPYGPYGLYRASLPVQGCILSFLKNAWSYLWVPQYAFIAWIRQTFQTCPDRSWAPFSLLYNGYRVFPGSKERPGRDADPSPPSSAIGHERVELYLYSPYGPYGLYRASLPVQRCTLPFFKNAWSYLWVPQYAFIAWIRQTLPLCFLWVLLPEPFTISAYETGTDVKSLQEKGRTSW